MELKNKDINILEGNNKIFISNSNNKSWVKMNKSFYDKYIDSNDEDNKLLDVLNKYSILEDKDTEYEFKINSIYMALTKKCNLECEFCSMKSNPRVSVQNDLSFNEIKDYVIPKVKDISPNRIVLTGGEPILRNDIVEIISLLRSELPKVKLSLQTNGLLITKEFIENIKDDISLIEISIENIFDNDKILNLMKKNLDILKTNNVDIGLSFVVDNNNKKYIKDALDIVEKYNTRFSMKLVAPIGFASENKVDYLGEAQIFDFYKDTIEHILEKKYENIRLFDLINAKISINKNCGAYGKVISIYPNGDIFMCHSLDDCKFNIGNITTMETVDIKDKILQKINDESIKNMFIVDNVDTCKDCSIKYLCSGFCAAERKNIDNIERLQVSCNIKKIIADYILFYKDDKKDMLYNFNQFLEVMKKNKYLGDRINANSKEFEQIIQI